MICGKRTKKRDKTIGLEGESSGVKEKLPKLQSLLFSLETILQPLVSWRNGREEYLAIFLEGGLRGKPRKDRIFLSSVPPQARKAAVLYKQLFFPFHANWMCRERRTKAAPWKWNVSLENLAPPCSCPLSSTPAQYRLFLANKACLQLLFLFVSFHIL